MPEDPIDAGPIRDFDAGTASTASPAAMDKFVQEYRSAEKRAFALDLFCVLLSGAGIFACALAASKRRRR